MTNEPHLVLHVAVRLALLEVVDMNRFKSRKFLLALAILIVLTWLRLVHEITSADFVSCLKILVPAYFFANVGQKAFVKPEAES